MRKLRVSLVLSLAAASVGLVGCETAETSAARHASGPRFPEPSTETAAVPAGPVADPPAETPFVNSFEERPQPALRRPTMTSDAGREFIKQQEGLRLRAYRDVSGATTIGWGHRVLPGERRRSVTRWEADQIFSRDIVIAEAAVRDGVSQSVLLTQGQFDALVSFVFNVGPTAFRNSTLLLAVNRSDFDRAKSEFKRWTGAGARSRHAGLAERREREAEMFDTDGETTAESPRTASP